MTKTERQNKKLIALEHYYFQSKELLEDLERKLGLKEKDQEPILIDLQIRMKGDHEPARRS